jgi:hypothetical protein
MTGGAGDPPVPLSADAVSIIGDRTRRLDAGHTVAVTKESSTRTLSADEERIWEELHALVGSLAPDKVDQPGYFQEGWPAKDLIAHIGSWLAEAGIVLERIRFEIAPAAWASR